MINMLLLLLLLLLLMMMMMMSWGGRGVGEEEEVENGSTAKKKGEKVGECFVGTHSNRLRCKMRRSGAVQRSNFL